MTTYLFKSSDQGAVPITGQIAGASTGGVLNTLKSILVNGYNSGSCTITRSGTIATVTRVGHGFENNRIVEISGASETEYNGKFRVTYIDADTFSYTVTGTPTTPATGTITCKMASIGWTMPYTSGNTIAAFRQPAGSTGGRYLWVNDGAVTNAKIRGYEAMTAHSTGTGAFPTTAQTSTGLFVYKNWTNDSTALDWVIISNGAIVYINIKTQVYESGGLAYATYAFGDIYSYKQSDLYKCIIMADFVASDPLSYSNTCSFPYCSGDMSTIPTYPGNYLDRSYTGTGSSIIACLHIDIHKITNGLIGSENAGCPAFPHPVDNSLIITPVWIHEPVNMVVRGHLPGIWCPYWRLFGYAHGIEQEGAGDLAGKRFLPLHVSSGASYGMALFETTDGW